MMDTAVDPRWLTGAVCDLLADLNSRDLPILADALEESGCDDQDILEAIRERNARTTEIRFARKNSKDHEHQKRLEVLIGAMNVDFNSRLRKFREVQWFSAASTTKPHIESISRPATAACSENIPLFTAMPLMESVGKQACERCMQILFKRTLKSPYLSGSRLVFGPE